jgi:hypothetical protein
VIGYHHILMVFIAIAIILLCKSQSTHKPVLHQSLTDGCFIQPYYLPDAPPHLRKYRQYS